MATKLQVPVSITDPVRKDVAEGKFALSLPRCELRQCVADVPLALSGAGFVNQEANGELTLRMFVTEKYDVREGMSKLGMGVSTPGVIIPATSYYDISGTAQNGATWRAEHQSVSSSFGIGTEVHARLTHVDKVEALPKSPSFQTKRWFIPGEFELPWHVHSGARRDWNNDRFEFGDNDFAWALEQADGGVDAMFTAKRLPLEPHATRFMQALEMLVGRSLRPLVTHAVNSNERMTRVHRRPKWDRSGLGPPIELRHVGPGDSHRFLACCLHRAAQPSAKEEPLLALYRFWYRILRAHQRDIENSSLVLSVAIEGVIKSLFTCDVDATFSDLANDSLPAIDCLEIDGRVKRAIRKCLEHAALPKPQNTLQLLTAEGVISDVHIKAWKAMRNAGAHGALLEDDEERLQKHIDRYYCCLDLFYRLLFIAIGYEGGFTDYSTRGWPASMFATAGGRVTPA